MSIKMSRKAMVLLAGLAVGGLTGFIPAGLAASPPKATISEDASAAVAQMGKSLACGPVFRFRLGPCGSMPTRAASHCTSVIR